MLDGCWMDVGWPWVMTMAALLAEQSRKPECLAQRLTVTDWMWAMLGAGVDGKSRRGLFCGQEW